MNVGADTRHAFNWADALFLASFVGSALAAAHTIEGRIVDGH